MQICDCEMQSSSHQASPFRIARRCLVAALMRWCAWPCSKSMYFSVCGDSSYISCSPLCIVAIFTFVTSFSVYVRFRSGAQLARTSCVLLGTGGKPSTWYSADSKVHTHALRPRLVVSRVTGPSKGGAPTGTLPEKRGLPRQVPRLELKKCKGKWHLQLARGTEIIQEG